MLWIARLVAIPTLWVFRTSGGELSSITRGIIAAVLLTFLLATAMQSTRTSAKLALFTAKLGIAVLIAALIRVRDGFASVAAGFGIAGLYPPMLRFTSGTGPLKLAGDLSDIASYAAPLGLFAAEYALRISNRKQVSLTVLSGVTLPICLALCLSSIAGMATAASHVYQPSLDPTIAMALWSHTSGSASPSRMLVAGMTAFGAVRFGIRALAECGPAVSDERLGWFARIFALIAVAILALRPYATASIVVFDISAKCMAVVGAVLTADVAIGLKAASSRRRFDTVGMIALLAGVVTALWLPEQFLWAKGQWWLPWLLPAYAVGFLITFVGRSAQRLSVVR